ncbi:unnamed protein product, partial [Discosporangium mesarthrocarpum]
AGAGNSGGGLEGAARSSKSRMGKGLLITAGVAAAVGAIWHFKEQEVRALYRDSVLDRVVNWVMMAKPFTDPSREKLMPDWPPPQAPPDIPCPPTLVLDLEGTLVASQYSRKNGWRTAKRPGLDAFLKEMHQLYEIVVFTDSHGGFADQ